MAKPDASVTGAPLVTTTRERPDSDEPQPDPEYTLVDGSLEDRWNDETEARPEDRSVVDADPPTADAAQPTTPEPPPVTGPVLPDAIGPYRIERRLGAGGMGTVYLGEHQETGEVVAVKVLSAALAREPEIIERFNREIDAMRKLSGPHIVSLIDSGTDPEAEQMYFAMEYVDGQTLGQMLRERRRLSWGEAVDIAMQICVALKAAHAAGIVHRDLKPSNLLIGRDGLVHLTDFGVAQVFASQRLTVTGGIIGTAEFMSPEQAEGRRCTKKSDLYSLGAVIYAMLTGRPPFTGKTSLEILRQHLTGRFDRPSMYVPDTPRLLDELVCMLLEKNPDDRHPDAHIVSLRLREVVRRVELAAATETPFKGSLDDEGLVAPTAAGRPGADATSVGGSGRGDGPGPATMVRNAVRSEIELAHRRSPLARFFDQTWVLVTSLVLVILGGIWWFQVMQPGASEPTQTGNEVSRFQRVAASYRRLGDVAREEQILRALRNVIQYDETRQTELEQIDERLSELTSRRETQTQGYQFGAAGLQQADDLIRDGRVHKAEEVLRGLLVLYESEPGARELVQALRSRLGDLESTRDSAHEDELSVETRTDGEADENQ